MSFTTETAPPQILIEGFYSLIDPFLLEADEALELGKLLDELPEDAQAIASSLRTWCHERPEISEALEEELRNRGPVDSIPAAQPEDYKTLLKNKLRESFPELPKKPQTPKQ